MIYGEIGDEEKISDLNTFRERMQKIYEHARDTMETHQEISTTYYDKKVLDDKLTTGDLVYVYLPRNRRIKLTEKFAGPAEVTKCNHPVYEIKRKTKKGDVTQWTIRNKLKRAPSNAVLYEWEGEYSGGIPDEKG